MASVGERAKAQRDQSPGRCSALGCHRTTQRAAGAGLSERYCKVHINFHARHGSYWRKSFSASELSPFVGAAETWLEQNRDSGLVTAVVRGLDGLLDGAGRPVSAYDLRSLPPAEKARVALARLHEAGVRGRRLLQITLAVCSLAQHQGMTDQEFVEVQIAKAVHRLASGTHRTTSGLPMRAKYAPSSGKVLRLLGHAIWELAAFVAEASALRAVDYLAEPLIPLAAKAEADRLNRLAVRKNTSNAIERRIEQARASGMGPQRLAQLRRSLRTQYGLD